MLQLRSAQPDDLQLLRLLLLEAAFWRPNNTRPTLEDALRNPELARYVDGFGRAGDLGVVAEEGKAPLGAAWWRHFPADAPGYGFLDEQTPEITLAVFPGQRGRGVGTELLQALVGEARDRGITRLSLSVEHDNPALALYERIGFRAVEREGNSLTMAIEV